MRNVMSSRESCELWHVVIFVMWRVVSRSVSLVERLFFRNSNINENRKRFVFLLSRKIWKPDVESGQPSPLSRARRSCQGELESLFFWNVENVADRHTKDSCGPQLNEFFRRLRSWQLISKSRWMSQLSLLTSVLHHQMLAFSQLDN